MGTIDFVDDDYPILTPEKVVVSFPVCSIGSRITAHFIDLILVVILFVLLNLLISLLMLGGLAQVGITILADMILGFAYFILQEWLWQGQTVGKRAAGIRVIMRDGTPVTGLAAFYRNIVRFADFIPGYYAVGLIAIFTNRAGQRLGDFVAGTAVIRTVKPIRVFAPAPHRYGIHPFEDKVGSLNRMTIEEYFAIKRLCDRFPELPLETQRRSLVTVWEPFAANHKIEPIANVHPVYQMEAVVMKFGREHKLV